MLRPVTSAEVVLGDGEILGFSAVQLNLHFDDAELVRAMAVEFKQSRDHRVDAFFTAERADWLDKSIAYREWAALRCQLAAVEKEAASAAREAKAATEAYKKALEEGTPLKAKIISLDKAEVQQRAASHSIEHLRAKVEAARKAAEAELRTRIQQAAHRLLLDAQAEHIDLIDKLKPIVQQHMVGLAVAFALRQTIDCGGFATGLTLSPPLCDYAALPEENK